MQAKVDAFIQELLAHPQYVLVDFSAPWCGLCRMLHPILNRMASEWGEALKLIPVDVDQNLALAQRYQIRSLPTLLLFHQGVEIMRLSHFSSREDLIRHCEYLIQEYMQESLRCS